MESENNIEVLNKFYKNVKMGMESYNNVIKKVENDELKQELEYQYDEYNKLLNKLNSMFEEYNIRPEDAPIGAKVMSWTGVQMNTLIDNTSSHISDMVIQGLTMGITESIKLQNENEDLDFSLNRLLDNFVKMQQDDIEKLKEYL